MRAMPLRGIRTADGREFQSPKGKRSVLVILPMQTALNQLYHFSRERMSPELNLCDA